ncbi:MAG: hypothetical protein SNJ52_05725, partial [Verrucomicrobiia bacterium]
PFLAVLIGVITIAVAVWGGSNTISISVNERPLGEVIHMLSKQSGIPIYTTLPKDTKVTLHYKRAPLAEVLETLAVRTEGSWTAGYVIAPNKAESHMLTNAWENNSREKVKLVRSRFPGGPFGFFASSETVFDPTAQRVKTEIAGPLSEALEKVARRVEATFLLPPTWEPTLPLTPVDGPLKSAVAHIAQRLGGTSKEVILLSQGWGRSPDTSQPGERSSRGNPESLGDNQQRGDRRWGALAGPSDLFSDPDIMVALRDRAEQQIAQLPPEEQSTARAEWEQWMARASELATLTPEQRREQMSALMQDPTMQMRMEERMTARDFRRTPEQRLQRYQDYQERKAQRTGRTPGQ